MNWCIVKTEAEFDAAVEKRKSAISLEAGIAVEVRLPAGYVPYLKCAVGAIFKLFGSSHAVLRESSRAVLWESSHAVLWESSRAELWESSHAELWGSSRAVLWESSHAELRESSHAVLWGSSRAVLRESSHAVLRESSRAVLWESSHAVLWESSRAVLWESSHAELWESSHAELRGSSRAVLRESSHASAYAAASLSLFGKTVRAKASIQVAVQLHDGAKCTGGKQIAITKPKTAKQWCEWYGAEIECGNAILFKAVNSEFDSPHGALYKPGMLTEAKDWDGSKIECGAGLHFSPSPSGAKVFNGDATKFVACLVPLNEIAVHPKAEHPDKVKARSCWNWYECDLFGKQIGRKHTPPKRRTTVSKKPSK